MITSTSSHKGEVKEAHDFAQQSTLLGNSSSCDDEETRILKQCQALRGDEGDVRRQLSAGACGAISGKIIRN